MLISRLIRVRVGNARCSSFRLFMIVVRSSGWDSAAKILHPLSRRALEKKAQAFLAAVLA
jgi:hypothetical protein